MKNRFFLLLTFMALACCSVVAETFSGYKMASEGAWCWFADPRAIHYENADKSINMSYVGYIDVHGSIKATQVNWNTGEKTDVLVRSFFQPDDHNNPTFLVLPDERVLIIYSRHTDEAAFYYRVSVKPGDISQLGEEKRLATANNTTYPSPFIMSDDPTHWYLCWRGISWHPTIARLTLPDTNDDVKFDWGPYQMVQSTGARPYAKYYSNGKDKLYVTYTTGHPDNESPNWVYFNVININKGGEPTLEDIKGNKLSTIRNGAFNVNKSDSYKSSYPYTVVDAPANGIRDWVWQIALDKQDRPCIAMVKINSGKTQHEYYYAKWTGSAWRLTDMADGGGKFHPSNTEYCYSGGEALDQQNPNVMYMSIPTEGDNGKVHEIWRYTLNDNGTIASKEQITRNSLKNNVRPFVLPGSEGSPMRVAWMNGDYYYWIVCGSYPKGYPTSIMCDYDLSQLKPQNKAGWTWTKRIAMDVNKYTGVVLATVGSATYGIDANAYPYVKIGTKTYRSQNKLYTSDAWQTNSATTDGKSYSSPLVNWNLAITFDGTTLTTYRNGLVDQIIPGVSITKPADAQDECLAQQNIQAMIEASALEALTLPQQALTDLVLPTKVDGEDVVWTTSQPDVISPTGIFVAPASPTDVVLVASTANATRTFHVEAQPRDIARNLIASYDFSDTKDRSGRGNDLKVYGSAKVNGVLDLTSNTAAGFSTNGYALVPASVMDSLRSYTILFEATPKSLAGSPRFYDFGMNSGNSIFCRADGFCAGIKYAGGTTTMTNGSTALQAGKTYKIAVTFDAGSKTTSIYVDGELVGSGNENQNEAYMISLMGLCNRNYIGRTQWWDSNVASSNLDYVGTIDNFMVYNTKLTRKEVCTLQNVPFEVGEYETTFVNGDFEDSYEALANSGVSSDRAIYVPQGWTIDYSTRDPNDLTALKTGDPYYSNFFAGKPKCKNGGNQTYWVRQRWGASVITLSQNVLLPAGEYKLTADVLASEVGGTNQAFVFVDDFSKAPTATNSWQTLMFNIVSDGETPVRIGCQASHTANEFICGFDNFQLTSVVPVGVTSPSVATPATSIAYDLQGRRVSDKGTSRKGIIIRGGAKILR